MTEISVQELRTRLESGEKLHLIDVREEWEYQEFNIGAENIPLPVLMNKLQELMDWKDEEVILHCKSGSRSFQAAQILKQFGFSNVKNVTGGLHAWQSHFGQTYQPVVSGK